MYSTVETEKVRQIVWDFYHDHGRTMPWREPEDSGEFDPYKILVSEIMLQQTQVSRVILKFEAFLRRFPNAQALAHASLAEVYGLWSGLGYNRRAQYLRSAAIMVVTDFAGEFPATTEELMSLPGVGTNTAGAIMAYAFNQPVLFVETNIRTVIIYHFFANAAQVTDKEVLRMLAKLIDTEHPREFYWALMDYGSYLKQTVGNVARASKHYVKQSAFAGSKRQLRGLVLRMLAVSPQSFELLQQEANDPRLSAVLDDLITEKMVTESSGLYGIA